MSHGSRHVDDGILFSGASYTPELVFPTSTYEATKNDEMHSQFGGAMMRLDLATMAAIGLFFMYLGCHWVRVRGGMVGRGCGKSTPETALLEKNSLSDETRNYLTFNR